jgi:hypothetical protein
MKEADACTCESCNPSRERIDHEARARYMHRRAQLAEARLERAKWWIDAGCEWCLAEAKQNKIWPMRMPRFYVEEAKRAIDRPLPRPTKPTHYLER